jgi:UDP-3-O-[3-hydroxymyristoyl] N-acetylglucosamine deacetylase / 3-hydroxyacyl-[acyl-carrier-protein] dehydratase
MTVPNQQTLAEPVELEGAGLHTGEPVRLRLVPAEAETGIRFRRIDLDGSPEVVASLDNVRDTDLGTTLGDGSGEVRTVEHLLGAVGALGLDNLLVEVSGPEIPILDGSFRPFLEAIERAGLVAQREPAHIWRVSSPVALDGPRGGHYVCAPADDLPDLGHHRVRPPGWSGGSSPRSTSTGRSPRSWRRPGRSGSCATRSAPVSRPGAGRQLREHRGAR